MKTFPFSVKVKSIGAFRAVTLPGPRLFTEVVGRQFPPKAVTFEVVGSSATNAIWVPLAVIWPSGCCIPLTRTCPSASATSIPVTDPLLEEAMNSQGARDVGYRLTGRRRYVAATATD